MPSDRISGYTGSTFGPLTWLGCGCGLEDVLLGRLLFRILCILLAECFGQDFRIYRIYLGEW